MTMRLKMLTVTVCVILLLPLGCQRKELPSPQEKQGASAPIYDYQLPKWEAERLPEWYVEAHGKARQLDAASKVKVWEEAAAKHEESALTWATLAWALGMTGEYERALDAADQALAIDSQYGYAFGVKAAALRELDRLHEAVEAAQQGLLTLPAWRLGMESLWSLSRELFGLSATLGDDFLAVLDVADELERSGEPGAMVADTLRAGAYFMRGEFDRAEKTAEEALEHPGYRNFFSHPDPELILGMVRLYRGDEDVAKPFRERLGKRWFNCRCCWLTLAVDAANKDQWRKSRLFSHAYYMFQGPEGMAPESHVFFPLFPAEQYLWKSLKELAGSNGNQNPDKLMVLGLAHTFSKNAEEAIAAFEAALQAAPESKMAAALASGASTREVRDINHEEVLDAMREAIPSVTELLGE